ncbi:hypothetical protein Y032_0036g3331 [Ancylostoma ceylanicum]|uniref:Uncharacterized protein n=1 Tax=Ancylostoma ceylanicum TaxID=53326 RepID=A0A016UMI8_9BILA|nr:hypothetical protein Y032_0036g3331 [Ancylostoma ceylanicum]
MQKRELLKVGRLPCSGAVKFSRIFTAYTCSSKGCNGVARRVAGAAQKRLRCYRQKHCDGTYNRFVLAVHLP